MREAYPRRDRSVGTAEHGGGHAQLTFAAGVVEVWWTGLDLDATIGAIAADAGRPGRGTAGDARVGRDAARAWVRQTLATRLDMAVEEVVIAHDPDGAPQLDPRMGLTVSISHCEGFAAVALGAFEGVGVDIEPLSRRVREGVIERLLSEAERTALSGLAGRDRARALLGGWTAKEAAGKALGTGLGVNLHRLEVIEEASGPRLRDPGLGHLELRRWRPTPALIGAVAVAARSPA